MEHDPTNPPRSRRSSIFSIDHIPKDAGRSSVSCTLDPRLSILRGKAHKGAYENTYRMEPDKRFDIKEAKAFTEEILEENFSNKKYEAIKMARLAKRVSMVIKEKMKSLDYDRFKFVCNVTVGQQRNQGMRIASRFLWDAKRDNWFNCAYSNQELFAVASVYALYYE